MNLFTKENRLTDTENKRMVAKRERVGGEINKEFGNKIYALLYIKQIPNKDLMYSTGNYIQYLLTTYNGTEYKKEYIIHMNMNHFVIHVLYYHNI